MVPVTRPARRRFTFSERPLPFRVHAIPLTVQTSRDFYADQQVVNRHLRNPLTRFEIYEVGGWRVIRFIYDVCAVRFFERSALSPLGTDPILIDRPTMAKNSTAAIIIQFDCAIRE